MNFKEFRQLKESYKTVKEKFNKESDTDSEEISGLLDLHKKLKDMKKLPKELINIDSLVKGKSFKDFKEIMTKYSWKDTLTKVDKLKSLKKKIIAENEYWKIYTLNEPDEAYLFHGLTNWCISSGSKQEAQRYFNDYTGNNGNLIVGEFNKDYENFNDVPYEWQYFSIHTNSKNQRKLFDREDKQYNIISLVSEKIFIDYPLPKFRVPDFEFKVPNNWSLNEDGTYNVKGDVEINDNLIVDRKIRFKFKKVSGDFIIFAQRNKLDSLEGCPEEVGGSFNIRNCNFKNLKFAPKKVDSLICTFCELESLEGCPENIIGNFDCSNNNLKDLKGGPKSVGAHFLANNNKIENLKYFPKSVGRSIELEGNKITSMKGLPDKVNGNLDCSNNKLKDLDGLPKSISNGLNLVSNFLDVTREDILKVCKVKKEAIHLF